MAVAYGEVALDVLTRAKAPKQQRPRVKQPKGVAVAQVVRAQEAVKVVLKAACEDAEMSRILGKARRYARNRVFEVVRVNGVQAELRDLTRDEQWQWLLEVFRANTELPKDPPDWWRQVW